MLELFSLDDNKKIGMLLLLIAGFLYFFAILLLFARSLLLLSNLFFLAGLYFFIGFAGLFKFFVKKGTYGAMAGKLKGSLVYFLGLLLIVGNMGFFGAIAQIAGIVMIFRTFLPDLYDYVCRVPVVGKYLKSYWLQNALEKLAGTSNRI